MEKNKTFCVIEDNIPNRKIFSMLIKGGYKVANFGNASDALQWLKENNVDLIILDILLLI
jgi:CheY-like chemotaxis protein